MLYQAFETTKIVKYLLVSEKMSWIVSMFTVRGKTLHLSRKLNDATHNNTTLQTCKLQQFGHQESAQKEDEWVTDMIGEMFRQDVYKHLE